ncbi:MAG: prepilin-type N-terminal cleavage/methylation domain-containing protein [Gemmatimonadota bacterium]
MIRRPGGFTLVETLIALVLSSIVIVLVSTTFLVQNRYQALQVLRAAVHDNARSATDVVVGELRSSPPDGIILAGNRTLTVRSPVALASVCGRSGLFGTVVDLHIDGGVAGIETDEIAGVALHDPGSGDWDYARAPWSFLDAGNTGSSVRCEGNGADTTAAIADFHAVRRLYLLFGFTETPDVGELVMLFRETTFTIRPSDLDSMSLALFREPYGEAAVEFASGIDTTAYFQYRLGGTSYQDTVDAGSVDDIDAVRIVLYARRPSESLLDEDVTFGWATNRALRNAP